MPRPACPKCGEKDTSRRKREGLLQILIYPRLGRFPWQCSSCRNIFIVNERGKSKRRPIPRGGHATAMPSSPRHDREEADS